MAFRFSEFLCVWPKPNDGGGRSQDGDVKFGVLESTGYTTSSSSWCEGASHPGASHPPEYKTGHRRGWTRSPCSWNKGQQSTAEACLLQETAGSAERTTRLRAVQGWPRGWRTRVCVWGRRRGRVCVCARVYKSPVLRWYWLHEEPSGLSDERVAVVTSTGESQSDGRSVWPATPIPNHSLPRGALWDPR